jgi:hypothetical protein
MRVPKELRLGGTSSFVAGVDLARLIDDAMSFLENCFDGDRTSDAQERRDLLMDRFSQAIPHLSGEPRGYLAMGLEALRRAPIE